MELCKDCQEKRKTVPDWTCLYCSLGIKKDETKKTIVHVDIKDIVPGWDK